MQIETITIQINEFELKTLRDYLRMGIRYRVNQIFEEENKEDFETFINEKNSELEFMTALCNIYNNSNLVDYAKRIYNDLTDK